MAVKHRQAKGKEAANQQWKRGNMLHIIKRTLSLFSFLDIYFKFECSANKEKPSVFFTYLCSAFFLCVSWESHIAPPFSTNIPLVSLNLIEVLHCKWFALDNQDICVLFFYLWLQPGQMTCVSSVFSYMHQDVWGLHTGTFSDCWLI